MSQPAKSDALAGFVAVVDRGSQTFLTSLENFDALRLGRPQECLAIFMMFRLQHHSHSPKAGKVNG
jgi:hypothetical protein